MPQEREEGKLEVMCFRQGKKGLDVLLRKENTLGSYWHNFMSSSVQDQWTLEKASEYFEKNTHIKEKLRWAGEIVSEKNFKSTIYCTVLTEMDQNILKCCPEQIMWVNGDVLMKKLVERPEKFKPELLEIVETCLQHLHRDHDIAV